MHTATRCPLLWGTVTVHEFYGGYLKKECVFTLMPGEYRTPAPCADTRCARCPSYFLKTSNDLSIKARLSPARISPFNWTRTYSQKFRPRFPYLFKGRLNATLTGLVYFTPAFLKTNLTLNFEGWEAPVDQLQLTDLFSLGPRYPVGYCGSESENG